MSKGKVQFKKGYVFAKDGSISGKNISTLQEAQNLESECGCGVFCDQCYSYFTLWDFDTVNEVRVQKAVYMEDGVLIVDTVENVRAAQAAYPK